MGCLLKMDRFWSKAEWQGECLVWTTAHNIDGYGRFHFNKKLWMAHRLAYTLQNGEIPSKMQILHMCDNPPCINVNHLFLGSNRDNVDDKVFKNRQARNYKTHCKNNHEYTSENTLVRKQGWKECRMCIRFNQKEARKRKKVLS